MNDTSKKSRKTTDEKAFDLHGSVTTDSEDDAKHVYSVPSSKPNKFYKITHFQDPLRGENEWICECDGFTYNGHKSLYWHCSHIKAVHLAFENGIITHTHSIGDTTMSNAKIEEARLTGQIDSDVLKKLLLLKESDANTTDICITMRIRANDFKLRETTFSCLNGLSGTVVVVPADTEIDVKVQSEQHHEADLPADQMPAPQPTQEPELISSANGDSSLPF